MEDKYFGTMLYKIAAIFQNFTFIYLAAVNVYACV